MALFLSFLIAMFVTMLLIPPLMRTAQRWQFVDLPNERKVHTQAVPRIGGIAMVIGAVIPIALWLMPDREIIGLMAGIAIILVFGVWDDRRDLHWRVKIVGQLLASVCVVWLGDVRIGMLPFIGMETLPDTIAIPLTIFVLLGVTNAINLSDGLDGLAGGTTLLSLGMIALLGYLHDQMVIVMVALAVIGSILGFLRFNTYPASIFMGDGGSQFLGFSLGVLVIVLTLQPHSPMSSALALPLLGLPLLDTAMVMVQRLRAGRSPFSADKNHIHHKLLTLGFDHYEAVFAIYLVQALLVTSAYFLRYQSDIVVVATYVAVALSLMIFFHRARIHGWRLREARAASTPSSISKQLRFLRQEGGLSLHAARFAAFSIPVYLGFVIALADGVTSDIGMLALGLFVVLAVNGARRRGAALDWLERASLYVVTTLVVYLAMISTGALEHFVLQRNLYFVVLAIAVVLGFRFSRSGSFRMTTLDFLVIFIALAVPNLPGLPWPSLSVGEFIAKIIVLYYGIELMVTNYAARGDAIRIVLLALLGAVAIRSMAF